MKFRILSIICFALFSANATAQNGDSPLDEPYEPKLLTIKELTDQGKHLEAILRADEDKSNKPLGEIVSAAKSAWALSLVSSARKYWDEALANKDCVGVERARTLLARGLMEFQEMNYEQARGLAEEGTALIPESELRGELWLLIGESLKAQDLYSISESYFVRASAETSHERKQEAYLSLAQVQKQLGKIQDARLTLTKIELNSKITIRALTELVNLDSSLKNSQGVKTWIGEGRKSFPSEFATGENIYNQVKALVQEGQIVEAKIELDRAKTNIHEDSAWLQLARAVLEEKQANLQISDTKK